MSTTVGQEARDYKRPSTYPDSERIPASLPPAYQPASNSGVPDNQNCGNCGYYNEDSKKCGKFAGYPVVRNTYWCLMWEQDNG
jgi:hypothetical protein